MKLGKKEKVLGFIFGVFAVLFLMDKVVFSPFLEKLEIIDAQIEANEEKLGRILYIDSQKEKITEAIDKIGPYMKAGKTEEDFLSIMVTAERLNVTINISERTISA